MNYSEIAATVLLGYETLIRSIPTRKSFSVIHSILKALVFVSGFLDNKKGKTGAGPLIPLLLFSILSFASCKSVETITCKSTRYIDITVLKGGKYYSTTIPICDTVIVIEKPKTAN